MQENTDASVLSDLKGEGKGKEAGKIGNEVKKAFFLPFKCHNPLIQTDTRLMIQSLSDTFFNQKAPLVRNESQNFIRHCVKEDLWLSFIM